MKKPILLLLMGGFLVVTGIVLSVYATQLLIENLADREVHVTSVIGYLPQDKSLMISIFGFIVILVGLVGLAIGSLYIIKNRDKSDAS